MRRALYLVMMALYGVAYLAVIVAVAGLFFGPLWLVAVAWGAARAGTRPTLVACGAVLGGYAAACAGSEIWWHLQCNPPRCGMSTLPEDLAWLTIGAGELLAGIGGWWWFSRSPRPAPEAERRAEWTWYALALGPVLVVGALVWAHFAAG